MRPPYTNDPSRRRPAAFQVADEAERDDMAPQPVRRPKSFDHPVTIVADEDDPFAGTDLDLSLIHI